MKTQIGPRAVLKQMRYHAHEYAKTLPQLPLLATRVLQQLDQPPPRPARAKYNPRLLAGTLLLIAAAALWITGEPHGFWQHAALAIMAAVGIWQWLKPGGT